MTRRPDLTITQAVLLVLTVAVIAVLMQTANTSAAAFSVSNDRWNGTSEVRSVATEDGIETTIVVDTSAYESVPANETMALVLAPDSAYRPAEILRVSQFVRQGGTLVVADDRPRHTNPLLDGVGASARLGNRSLFDVRSNYLTPAMPVATGVADRPPVKGVESLTLNHATVVESNRATVLINTSENAYVDTDGNRQFSGNETLESRPVVTIERVGEGRVVVVSDASVFINSMLSRSGNRQFVRGLLARESHLLVDFSHRNGLAPLPRLVLLLRNTGTLQFGVGLLAVGGVAVWVRWPLLWCDT